MVGGAQQNTGFLEACMAVELLLVLPLLLGAVTLSHSCHLQSNDRTPLKVLLLTTSTPAAAASDADPPWPCWEEETAPGACCNVSGAVQLAVDHVNRNCTVLKDHILAITHSPPSSAVSGCKLILFADVKALNQR